MCAFRPTILERFVAPIVGGVCPAQRQEDPHQHLQVRAGRAERVPETKCCKEQSNIHGESQHPWLKEVATHGDKRDPSDAYEYEPDEEIGFHSGEAVRSQLIAEGVASG